MCKASLHLTTDNDVKRCEWDDSDLAKLIELYPPTLYRSLFKGDHYWFGYMFKPDARLKDCQRLINEIRGLDDDPIPEGYLAKFINDPLALLDKQISLASIDFIVYPTSRRSPLVNKMIAQIDEWTSHEIKSTPIEMIKLPPDQIAFDWGKFDRRYQPTSASERNTYRQMREYVEERLLPTIRNGEYFSMALYVRARYRPYIMNFLAFSNEQREQYEAFRDAQSGSVLVVDDVVTTGSTLNEIMRKLAIVNPRLDVYVFTLLGAPEGF